MSIDDGLAVATITASLDGFVAGPNQSLENPLGEGAERLHAWMFDDPDSSQSIIDTILGVAAVVQGRNMFGPIRGEWPDASWRGWWGEDPPYHAPVFVLTHYAREPEVMEGGTTFHFVTGGIEEAFARAREAAGPTGHISIAGGASTVRQALNAGLLDRLVLSIAPITLGAGERLFDGVQLGGAGGIALKPVDVLATPLATHVTYEVVR
ncbi:dihydrofolate reductase [Agromyces terreus]|uniref:Dihydrofolate reductase n=1 Tax=Agromyces terreus TaxID=424795 RepID=A0A9X2GZC6_9MICO|nr:dihydrofolate reductase family protein [Agromyces terreus]MCP2370261.1 dihydrofolate reductase [Agromyces terreus]